jgi:hypothetical protein
LQLYLGYLSIPKVARESVPYNALNDTGTLTGHTGSGRTLPLAIPIFILYSLATSELSSIPHWFVVIYV